MQKVRQECTSRKDLFRQILLLCACMLILHTALLHVTTLFDYWLGVGREYRFVSYFSALNTWRVVHLAALVVLHLIVVAVFLSAGWLAARQSGTSKTGLQVGFLAGISYGLLSFLPNLLFLPATRFSPPHCVEGQLCTLAIVSYFNPLGLSLMTLPILCVLLGGLIGWFGGLLGVGYRE
jgi:hypothetical protein